MVALADEVTQLGLRQDEAAAALRAAVEEGMGQNLRTFTMTVGDDVIVSSVVPGSNRPILLVSSDGSVVRTVADIVVEGADVLIQNIKR